MEADNHNPITIDAREIPANERHERIIQIFKELLPGQELYIISNHEPIHLIDQMRHEGLPFVESAYTSIEKPDGSYQTTLVKEEVSESADGIKFTSMDKERHYSENRFSPIGIYSTDTYKVILTYIKSGQCIPVHSPRVDLIFAVISGTGKATAGNKEFKLGPGSILIVPRGERRGVVAETDIEGIHIVSPVPGEIDHLEVQEKLGKGECA